MQNILRFLLFMSLVIVRQNAHSQTHSFVSIRTWPLPKRKSYGLYAYAFKIVFVKYQSINKIPFLLTSILMLVTYLHSFCQSDNNYRVYPSVPAYYTLPIDKNGLSESAFYITPKIKMERWEKNAQIILNIDRKQSTPRDPSPSFTYKYNFMGRQFGDQHVGYDPFMPIKADLVRYEATVVYGAYSWTKIVDGMTNIFGPVDKNAKASEVFVNIKIVSVEFKGTGAIENEIIALKNKEKSLADDEVREKQKVIAQNKAKADEEKARKLEKEKLQRADDATQSAAKKNTKLDDDFWSDKSSSKTTTTGTAGNVIPDQASHKNLPDFVRTTDGGYFQRGADGKFREVSADEYQQAKKQVADSKAQAQKEPEQPKITPEEFGAQASKNFRDQVAQNNAIYENIDRKFDMYKQNFYHAQAIQSGKENLSGLSRLEGNYSSVQELEAEFNQKYNSIRGEVNNIEQARNSQLNNAVNNTFNGNSTEQAIGQGMQIIGSMINNAQAAKERKQAQAALKLERDQQLAAMAAAKTRARIELRTKLVQSFPNGGTPLISHKVTLPEVYVFAYVNDKATINNEQALVSLSNVFPVQQYSDGTYPYKTTVLNKLKGYAQGEITLVGYYGDKARAEEMRNAFINLAAKSEMAVKPFTVKTVPGSTSLGSKGGTSDFWETGKKPATKPNENQGAEKKKDTFWDN